mmetsp:Transcript_23734/g.72548  ORF Transcript_23734/g.72548 Transcript_23734/m.72548 type:complete len:270 (+) Transcript_23734:511-1320(+)
MNALSQLAAVIAAVCEARATSCASCPFAAGRCRHNNAQAPARRCHRKAMNPPWRPAPAPDRPLGTCAHKYDRYFQPAARHSPDLPPDLRRSLTSRTTMPFDAALHMSYTVSAATAAALIASISTPVPPSHAADALTTSEWFSGRNEKSTAACEMSKGWQRGMSSDVRLAAPIPATRATARTSPLALEVRAPYATGPRSTVACATASRRVRRLWPTSTIDARPESSTCVSTPASQGGGSDGPPPMMWRARTDETQREAAGEESVASAAVR